MQEVYEHEEETQNATSSLTHEAENTTTGEQSTLPQTSSDEESAFSFVIADPIKKQGTSKLPFWVYKITATTNLPQYKSKTLVIERRYSDFEWLFEKLQLLHPGCIVPPIPEKSALGTVEKIFSNAVDSKQLVQYRQRALLKFMTRVGEHPVLQKSQALQQFLEISNERDFEIAKKGKVEKAPQASFGLFKKQISKEPEWITNLKTFTNYLEEGLKWMKTKLQEMVQRRKLMASSVADFGKGFRHLGLVEKAYEESTMSRSLIEVSQKAELLSGLITAQADRETIHLVETFTYYLGVCEVIKRNMKFLEGLRMARDDATTNLKTQQAALEKLQKTPNVKEEKVKQQEQVVNDAAQKESRLGEDLKQAEDTFKSDVERFNLERKVDFAYMLRSFTILQVEHAESVKTHWESLLPSISLMTSESSEVPPVEQSAEDPVSLGSLSLQPSSEETTTTTQPQEPAEEFIE